MATKKRTTKKANLGKGTVTGRAKKAVRKSVTKAKKSLTKKISTGLKSTIKKVSRIIDKTVKTVKKTTAKRKSVKRATSLKGLGKVGKTKRTISAKARKAGSEVMAIAKKIHAAKNGKKWSLCVKEAGVEYRKNH